MDLVKTEELFDEIARRWIHDSAELKPSEVPDTVYHYTTAAGLEGALRSSRLWLTDFRFLNDAAEFKHATSIMEQVVTERLTESGPGVPAFYKHILDASKKDKGSVGHVFSLTTERDDLSQWRGYANDGSGFTLGFSGQSLYEGSKVGYNFSRVRYDQDTEQRALELALKEMVMKLVEECKKGEVDEDKLALEAGRSFAWLASNRAAYNKHPSFHAENEWRLVSYRRKNNEDINVRVSGGRLVPYVELDISEKGKLPLVSIGVGPGFTGAEVVDAVQSLARNYGYTPTIYFADTPYRRS